MLPPAAIPMLGSGGALSLRHEVDVFKRGDDGTQVLVSTTRPCPDCGEPLVGLLVEDKAGRQTHARHRKEIL